MVERLDERLNNFAVFCTDRHPGVKKRMSDFHSNIAHCFDLWHVIRSFQYRCKSAASKRANRELFNWLRLIINHLWFCVKNCNENADLCIELFTSLLNHVKGVHSWSNGVLVHGCQHEEVDPNDEDNWAYLDSDSPAYRALEKLVLDPLLERDLRHCYHNVHTGSLESHNSLHNMYAPKRSYHSVNGHIDRSILAALDNNYNVGRGCVDDRIIYSKQSSRWIEKKVHEKKSEQWRYDLHKQIIDVANTPKKEEYEAEIYELFQLHRLPKASAPIPRPTIEADMPPKRRRRFK